MTTKHAATAPAAGTAVSTPSFARSVKSGARAAYSEHAFLALVGEEADLFDGLNYVASLDLLRLPGLWTDGFLAGISASLRQIEARLATMRSHLVKPPARGDREGSPDQPSEGQPTARSHKRKPAIEYRAGLYVEICLSRSCIDFDLHYLGLMLKLLSSPAGWTAEHLSRVFVSLEVLQGRVALLRGQIEQARLRIVDADLAMADATALFPPGFDPAAIAEDAKWMYPPQF